jgi:hypothetical protein
MARWHQQRDLLRIKLSHTNLLQLQIHELAAARAILTVRWSRDLAELTVI